MPSPAHRRICLILSGLTITAAFSSASAIVVPLDWREGQTLGWPEDSARDTPVQISKVWAAAARRTGPSVTADQPLQTAPRRRITLWDLTALAEPSIASVPLFTYDFPGNPGSGLAANQTSGQPANATFSDFTRTNLDPANYNGAFRSANWAQTLSINTSQYTSFNITAAAGFELTLSMLTFDALRSGSGPSSGQVSLFLNGSATPYATFSYSPTTSLTNFSFDFADILAGSNVTSASFRFYGWNNPGGASGQLLFDNVVTYGAISPVPEMNPAACAAIACLLAAGGRFLMRWRSRRKTAAGLTMA